MAETVGAQRNIIGLTSALAALTGVSQITVTLADHGFVVGDVLRHNGTTWVKAQADSLAGSKAMGLVKTVTSTSVFVLALTGRHTITGIGSVGDTLFLSAATAGAVSTTDPALATAGAFSVRLGHVVDTDEMVIEIVRDVEPSVVPDVASGFDFDFDAHALYARTITAETTITITMSDGRGGTLVITQANPSETVNWPVGIVWLNGAAPTIGNGQTAILTFLKVGSTIYGAYYTGASQKQFFPLGVSLTDENSTVAATSTAFRFRAPADMTLKSVRLSLSAASTSGYVEVDVKKNGTSIFSTKPRIDVNEKTSVTASVAYVLAETPTTFLADDEITFSISQAGVDAIGLKTWLLCER